MKSLAPWALVTVVVLGLVGFGALLLRAQRAPEGPQPIIWDKEACAHCRMHIGLPWMAAQVQLSDGRVLNFDDPGCLLLWLERSATAPRAVYVHHHQTDSWLTREQAAFVEVAESPMGFNLGAVEHTTPGALDWQQATARVLSAGAKR